MSKTIKELEKENAELRKTQHGFVEEMRKSIETEQELRAHIEHLKVNQKPEPKEYSIEMKGVQGATIIQQFEIKGISAHDALFLIEHATANLRQSLRLC